MTIKVAINGYGRIGRNVLRAHYEGGKKHDIEIVAINDLGNAGDQRPPDASTTPRTGRSRARWRSTAIRWSSTATGSACSPTATRPSCRGASWASTWCWNAPASSPARKRRRRTSGRREEGHHLGAGRQGRRRDHRLRRQPRRAQGQRHGDQQCQLHHQLPGAAGAAAARHDRPGDRADDDDPFVHQRPGADRRLPRGPAPRPQRHDQHDPDQDRRRHRGRPGAARAERPARRLRDARADDQRLDRRPELHRVARHHGGRSQRGS